jgi:ubiquinone/menaquinone biosynthesis C-methylase UbiE
MPEISPARLSIDVHVLPPAGSRVLDVGCGDGRHVVAAAQRGCWTVGVDYDFGELRRTQQRFSGSTVDLIAADAAHLPFRAESFHAVICTETLEHLTDDRAAMREISRVMKPETVLLGAVPSHFTEIAYFALSRGYRNAPGGHVRIYRPSSLFGRLAAAGLKPRSMRYIHFVDSLVWLRFCLTDFLKPRKRPRSDFEAAVLIAVAQERTVPTWRTTLRAAIARSRFIGLLDAAGAKFWPKSLAFVAEKVAVSQDLRDVSAEMVGALE